MWWDEQGDPIIIGVGILAKNVDNLLPSRIHAASTSLNFLLHNLQNLEAQEALALLLAGITLVD